MSVSQNIKTGSYAAEPAPVRSLFSETEHHRFQETAVVRYLREVQSHLPIIVQSELPIR